ncbi:MAG: nucleotide sugar dehydrogenase [Opitutaceae bacterium]|nr:nucleotide sugar dehydrogenase [Opitutaceae bacterium]
MNSIEPSAIRVGICGLGYVGLTTAACLLRQGFPVIGYEISEHKRAELAAGRCPLSEPGVDMALNEGLASGRFTVAGDFRADDLPDVVFVCVGTPSAKDGSTDLTAVRSVFSRLAEIAAGSPAKSVDVVLRSTVPPGTLVRLEAQFPELFARFSIVFYPEFLREGTAMKDFAAPPQTVIGRTKGTVVPPSLMQLFTAFDLVPQVVSASSAETLKMACNAFHALKVCFANEVGRVTATLGGDPNEVMRLFVQDTVLNISPRYLFPGGPYGGSCLPKDVRSFCSLASRAGVSADVLNQCELSNASHLQFLVGQILRFQPRRVALLGLAFKSNTDDLRESPSLPMAGALLSSGVEVRAHDFAIVPERVVGVNRDALRDLLRREGMTLQSSMEVALDGADVAVVMQRDSRYHTALKARTSLTVVDVAGWDPLVRIAEAP